MNIEELREYCLSLEDVTEKTPFGKFAKRFDSVLVFYILDHMFCMTDMDDFTSVTVKADPEVIEELDSRLCRGIFGTRAAGEDRRRLLETLRSNRRHARSGYGLLRFAA